MADNSENSIELDSLVSDVSPVRECEPGTATQNNIEIQRTLDPQFGTIKFEGSKKEIKVVKITANTKEYATTDKDTDKEKKRKEEEKNAFLKRTGEDLLPHLVEEWGWKEDNRPNLLISVTGGAWNFPFNKNIKEVFKKGIVEAAESANAWIVTGGTDVGVMKYTGTAVGDYEQAKTRGNEGQVINTIGIAVWGKLREDYRSSIDKALSQKTKETLDHKITVPKDYSSLEPNHSYFILVDDGTKEYGGDVPVRGGFEKAISKNWTVSGLEESIPVVCIVVEGGKNTIQQAREAVENEIPIVVVANSGRASNIMAEAFDPESNGDQMPTKASTSIQASTPHPTQLNNENLIKDKIKKMISDSTDEQTSCFKDIKIMKYNETFLNVYRETTTTKIDQVILKALIKARDRPFVQLQLAQTWNRRDIVEYSEILGHITETTDWKNYEEQKGFFEERLRIALAKNQLEFVQMFLENNIVNIDTFVTESELANLYKEINVCNEKKGKDGVRLGAGCLPLLQGTKMDICWGKDVLEVPKRVLKTYVSPACQLFEDSKERTENPEDSKVQPVSDPHRQMFIFAILNKYYDMAEFFWEQGREHIATALAASRILREVARKQKKQNTEVQENLCKKALEYEEKACGVLAECENQSEENDTVDVLKSPSPSWGYLNPLKLADLSESLTFIAEPSVKRLLDAIWCCGLEEEGKIYSKSPNQYRYRLDKPPSVKFWFNAAFYILFLIYFSWILTSGTMNSTTISAAEAVLIFWVGTFITEELRQALPQRVDAFGERPVTELKWKIQLEDGLKLYFSNIWNYMDILMLTLFGLGEVVKSFAPNSGRIILASSLVLFYLRFLRNLTVIRNVGPKVLMIFKTLIHFTTMVLILAIVLIGYGTAVHAIMFPHVSDPMKVAQGIFFRPIFQVYGNLFLEDLTATEASGLCTNNKTEITMGIAEACPQNVAWGVVFLVFYMVLSNVLLLNIFIAMFSIACEDIHTGADTHWAFQFFNITEEYYNRPLLPPPLIILEHIRGVIFYVYAYMKVADGDFVTPDMTRIKMEERCAYNYIRRKQVEKADHSRERILARLKELENMLQKEPKEGNSLSWWY